MINRNGLARRLAVKTNDTIESSEKTIKLLEETIVEVLLEGESINLHSFGDFEAVVKEATSGLYKNPQTGEFVDTARKVKPKFTFSKCIEKTLSNK